MGNPDFGRAARPDDPSWANLRSARGFSEANLVRLPYAEEEVYRVSQILGPVVRFVGAAATESAFKRNAPTARIIHLATHSFFDRENYLDSALLFAREPAAPARDEEDGILYLHEVMNLKLRATLVVLTGCETGLGRFRRGGGLEGLSHAFMAAGVPSVLGTLWPVQDNKTTASLITSFYKYLAKGFGKRAALSKAKLDVIHENPFYWAAPILIGDSSEVKIVGERSRLRIVLMIALPAFLLVLYFIRRHRNSSRSAANTIPMA